MKTLNDYTIKELVELGWLIEITKYREKDRENAIDTLFALNETRDHTTKTRNGSQWVQSGENPQIAVFFKKPLLDFNNITKTELTKTHLTVWFKPHGFTVTAELAANQKSIDDRVKVQTDLGEFSQGDLVYFMDSVLFHELEKKKEQEDAN